MEDEQKDSLEQKPASKKINITDFAEETNDESVTAEPTEENFDLHSEEEPIEDEVIDESEDELETSVSSEEIADDAAGEPEPVDELTEEELQSKTVEEALKEAEAKQEEQVVGDPQTADAVDDIVREESDIALEAEDSEREEAVASVEHKSFKDRCKGFFIAWWNHRLARNATFAILFLLLVAAILIPNSRYAILNTAGVRAKTSLRVIDSQTRLPLKNITVAVQQQEAMTDSDGKVAFEDMRLGASDIKITKIGYADNEQAVVLGWGSNPLGDKELRATGEQFTFILTDWLNGDAITDAEASSGENSAKVDDKGKIILTVGVESISDIQVTIDANGYRSETLDADGLTDGENIVKMVANRKHTFISNRNGEYDLYTIDLDGKNEKILLEATGDERDVPAILHHPSKNIIALISSRDGDRNGDGYLLDGLFIVDTETGESKRIARSERVQVVGWDTNRIVFWQVVEGTSAGNPERSKIVSYDIDSGRRDELAAANYFNDVRLIDGVVYYAVSSFAVPQSQAKLFTINTDGTNKQTLIDSQIYNLFREDYQTLLFSGPDQKWYRQTLGGQVESSDPQSQPANKRFVNDAANTQTAWVEIRDGRGVLLSQQLDSSQGTEEQLLSLAGLESIAYWINNDSLVFRVIKTGETADYVFTKANPEPIKLVDVTASTRLYY